MSAEKEGIENLTRKVDELIAIMKDLVEDLRDVSASLKSFVSSQAHPSTVAQPSVSTRPGPNSHLPGAPQRIEKSKAIEDVKMMFPEDLESLLEFEEKDEYVIIKPRQFLGTDNFSKIASIVRSAGGDYISAGKGSHFRLPRRTTSSSDS